MRTILIFSFLACFTFTNAQEYYTIKSVETDVFGFEAMPSTQLVLFDVNKKMVMDHFISRFKHETKNELKIDDNRILISDFIFKDVSSTPYNIYTLFMDVPEGCQVQFALRDSVNNVDLNEDVNGGSIKLIILDFAKTTYLEALEDNLKAQESHLKSLQGEYDKNIKSIEKLKKGNLKSQANIDNVNLEIEINRSEYETALLEYQTHKSIYTDADKNDINYKTLKANYNGAEKKKKNLEKEYLKLNETIYDEELNIQQNNSQISELDEDQNSLSEKIADQKAVVKEIEDIIYGISRK